LIGKISQTQEEAGYLVSSIYMENLGGAIGPREIVVSEVMHDKQRTQLVCLAVSDERVHPT
jgi:hypothetical protein